MLIGALGNYHQFFITISHIVVLELLIIFVTFHINQLINKLKQPQLPCIWEVEISWELNK
jgi:hypothetical protein